MTRHELISAENDLGRALISLDSGRSYEALAYAREVHRRLGEMLTPHEAGVSGFVKDIDPIAIVDATVRALTELGKAKE